MTNGAAGAAAGAAVVAAVAQAIKASGAIVRVESVDFQTLVERADKPLVVLCRGGFLSSKYQYLMGYKGLVFYAKTATPLVLPAQTEVIEAKKIWIPS